MVQLQSDLEEIRAAGVNVVGVSFDSVDILSQFAEGNQITYPLLSDEGSATINAYGIHNQSGYPHPGTFVIDAEGTIRAKLFQDGYRTRHGIDELITAAKEL